MNEENLILRNSVIIPNRKNETREDLDLSYYRVVVKDICDDYEIKRVEFETLLFAYHRQTFNMTGIIENIPASRSTLIYTLKFLREEGYVSVLKERSRYNPRIYYIKQKGKRVVNKFYKLFKEYQD